MKNIAAKLGLAAEADENAILDGITRLQNRIAQFDAEQVDGLLAERKITDEKIINRLKPVLAGMKNRDDRVGFLDECGFQAPEEKAAKGGTRVLNRGTGDPARPQAVTDDKTLAEKIMNRARELKGASPARSFDSCWQQAQRENTRTV